MKKIFLALLAVLGLLAFHPNTKAASTTINWTGLGADANWGTAANWTSTLKSGSGVSLSFSGTAATSNTNNVASLTLDSVSINASSASWNISGQSVSLSGTLTTSGTNTVCWNIDTKLTTSASMIYVNGGDTTFSGVISGTGRLNKNGTGTLILSSSNTYSGGTSIRAGVVLFKNVNAFGSGTITITTNSGNIAAGVSGTVANDIVAASSWGFSTNGYNVTLTGLISMGTIYKAGSGVLVLTNANNSQKETHISGGTLQYTTLGALSTTTVTIESSATLQAGISGTLSNSFNIIGGLATIDTQGYGVGLAGSIVNSGTLLKVGSGTLSIASDNSFNGSAGWFSIKEGTLRYDDVRAFGGGTVGFSGNSTLRAGASGTLSATGFDVAAGVSGTFDIAGLAVSSSAALTGSGTLVIDGNGSLLLHNAVHSISGGLVVSSGTLQLGDGTADVSFTDAGLSMVNNGAILYQTYTSGTIAGNLSGTGSLLVSGSGVLVLNGSNSFTGSTQVRQAELDVNGSFAGNITIGNGAILGGCGTVLGDVAVNAGAVYGRGGKLNLGNITFSGPSAVAGAVGARTVVVNSGTTATASASDLTASGTMTVKSGAAYVNSGTTSASVIAVEKGAVLTNGGALSGVVNVSGLMNAGGTVNGSLIIKSTGELAFGGGYGTATVSGSMVVESGAKISLQIGGNTPGVLQDQVIINGGSVTLEQGSILSLSLNGTIDSFVVLIDNRGTLQISGTFSTVMIGEKILTLTNNAFLYNGISYQLLYNVDADGDGEKNDIKLSVVPEPSVAGLILVGMGLWGAVTLAGVWGRAPTSKNTLQDGCKTSR